MIQEQYQPLKQDQQQQQIKPSKLTDIGGISSQSIQTDLLLFKDEVLRDIKKSELQMKSRIDKHNMDSEKRIKSVEDRIDILMKEVTQLLSSTSSNNSKFEELSKLQTFRVSTTEKLMSIEFNLNAAVRDISNACYKYDRLIANNVLIPGLAGDGCKYPNLKDLFQWILVQISNFTSFKDKQLIDLKGYKEKLEGLMSTFNRSIETVKSNFIDHCKESVQESEKNFTQRIAITDQLVEDLRIENGKYSKDLMNESLQFKADFDKLAKMKEEINKHFDEKLLEYRTENKATVEDVKKFSNEFAVIKLKFIELSEFIKDVRFRRNIKQEVTRREAQNMSKRINFDLKSTRKHIDDEKFKDYILNNKADDIELKELLSVSKRHSDSQKDLLNYSPSIETKGNLDDIEDTIIPKLNLNEVTQDNEMSQIKAVNDTENELLLKKVRTNNVPGINQPYPYTSPIRKRVTEEVNKKSETISIPVLRPVKNKDLVQNQGAISMYTCSKIDLNQQRQKEEQKSKESSSMQRNQDSPQLRYNSPSKILKKITIRGNQPLASSPINLVDNIKTSRESIESVTQTEFTQKLKIHDLKRNTHTNAMTDIQKQFLKDSNKPNTQATVSPNILNTNKEEDEGEESNTNNEYEIKSQSRNVLNHQKDTQTITKPSINNKANSLTQNLFNKTNNIKSKVNNLYLTSYVTAKPVDNIKDISDRILINETRMRKFEIEIKEILKYIKTYLIGKLKTKNNPKIESTKLQLINNPSGVFLPVAFDDKNIDDYFPVTQRRTNYTQYSKSQDERKKISKITASTHKKYQLPLKISHQIKPLSDDFRQTFSALSVLFTHKPKVPPNDNQNLLLKTIHPYTSLEQES